MEKHIMTFKTKFNPNELANIVYSYSKSPECNKDLLTDLLQEVTLCLDKAKPKEMVQMLMAYTETGKMTEGLLLHFENQFRSKFD